MRSIRGLLAEDLARSDGADRRSTCLHGAYLHRRRVRAQHQLTCRIATEGVLHVARGVIARNVQRFEVVPVQFDLGPVEHFEAHRSEEVLQLTHHLRDGMQGAALRTRRAQRGIKALYMARGEERTRFQGGLLGIERGLQLGLDAIGRLACGFALGARQGRDGCQQCGDHASLFERFARNGAQILHRGRRGDARQQRLQGHLVINGLLTHDRRL